MYRLERIEERHMNDWIEMMLQLWDDNSYEVLKAENINIINDDRYGNFICYSGEEAVGFINMSLRSDYVAGGDSYPVGYIEGIYVKAEHRRMGVARMLVEHGERWAREMGCRQVGSDCIMGNTTSYDFHRGIGFNEVERVICFIKNL